MGTNVRVLNYMDSFVCTAQNCSDNCCGKWDIDVDKATYDQWMNIFDDDFKEKVNEIIEINENTEKVFAKLKLKERCAFLSECGLCNMHSKHGEMTLLDICRNYPRNYNLVNDTLEVSLEMSCEEAVRVALIDNEKIFFKTKEYKLNSNRINSLSIKGENNQQVFFEIRNVVVEILQNRVYPLWKRMSVVLFMLEDYDKAFASKDYDGIIEVINNYKTYTLEEKLAGLFDDININLSLQFSTIVMILKNISKLGIKTKYKNLIEDFILNIGMNPETMESNLENYTRAYQNYADKYDKEFEYIFENYLVNEFIRTLFPVLYDRSIDSALYYCAIIYWKYVMIKGLVLGQLAKNKDDFNKMHIRDVIYLYEKTIGKDYNMLKNIVLQSNIVNVDDIINCIK